MATNTGTIIKFPSDIGESGLDLGYSCVQFILKTKAGGVRHEVFLPMPMGFVVQDNASYSDAELGTLGNLTETIGEGGSVMGMLNDIKLKNITDGFKAAVVKLGGGLGAAGDAGRILSKTIMAPNTNTMFEGVALRKFTFGFKLVPKTREDTIAIRNIVNIFRLNLYPETDTNGMTLTFPDTWEIHFWNGTKKNEYISKVWTDCYLENLGTTYNSSQNMFLRDGEPTETDITMSFRESKALHKKEMATLLDGEKPGYTPNKEGS